MVSSATKTTNAASYCVASHWFVRENWLCYVLLSTSRLYSSFFSDALQKTKPLFSLRLLQKTKYCVMRECENIHSWISLSGGLAFSHQQGIYRFKFPKRFLEISSRDLTLFSILIILRPNYQSIGAIPFAFARLNALQAAVRHSHTPNGHLQLNVKFPVVLVSFSHPPLVQIALLVARRGGCKEGTNTTGKATLSDRGPLDG